MAIRPERVRVFAPAKLNLFLHVLRKRSDGFHDLQSLVVFADIGDVLTIKPAASLSLELQGPFGAALTAEPDNLVLRAARAFAAEAGEGAAAAAFRLDKNLPVASGIGGGSADAAAVLRGLQAMRNNECVSRAALYAIAASLGSDIPVCLECAPAFMEGRGEILTPLPPLPELALVLVNPGVAVSTADVFCKLVIDPRMSELPPPPFTSAPALLSYLVNTRNDLEAPACVLQPLIREVLDALAENGAAFVRMSGSGATCFGVFANCDGAQRAASAISSAHPRWWCRTAKLAPPSLAAPQLIQ